MKKKSVDLKKTLRELERTLGEWDNMVIEKPRTQHVRRESEVALKTHLLFQALKDQIDELS